MATRGLAIFSLARVLPELIPVREQIRALPLVSSQHAVRANAGWVRLEVGPYASKFRILPYV